MNIAELEPRADEAAELLAAMANTKRLLILCHLLGQELSVGELAERAADLARYYLPLPDPQTGAPRAVALVA